MTKKKVQVKKSPYPSVTVYTPRVKGLRIEFPNISRFITEEVVAKVRSIVKTPAFFIHIFSGIILLAIAFQASTMLHTWKQFSSMQQQEAKLYQEVSYWQDITKRFANYRDGYFSLAVLYYRLGNDVKARENIEKALSIDPRFEQGLAFAKLVTR